MTARVGVFVDVANIFRNGGSRMRYDVLREFACRDGADPARLSAYVTLDEERAQGDAAYADRTRKFFGSLRDFGYKVIVKKVKWYQDETGNRFGKANADLDMAVDALLQSEKLDRVLLATGDGDFTRVVKAIQNRGVRVEIVACENVSRELREEADFFFSGHLVPNLIPVANGGEHIEWGKTGSRVRGLCYWHHEEQSYGFMRYLKRISPHLFITETRHPDSPYASVFLHDSALPLPATQVPSRSLIFEFTLTEGEKGLQAGDVSLVTRL